MNSEQEFAQSIYTIIKTFVDGPKTVSSLEAYFLSNQKAIKTMKDIDTSLYEKLINDFKEVKHAITSNGLRQGTDDPGVERSREKAVEQEALARRKQRTEQYREHHPTARFWKK